MEYRDRAIAAAHAFRKELGTIITEAVTADAYADVPWIAGIATALTKLLQANSDAHGREPWVEPSDLDVKLTRAALKAGWPNLVRLLPEEPANVLEKPSLRGRSGRDQYPRFLRDGDRLVKIAWSRKNGPYEHKAPRAVIQALVSAIQKRIGEGKLFQAGNVLPLKDALHEEYPSYQSYLALSWLRDVGIISKKGRDGYVLKPNAAKSERLERLWTELPEEESNDDQSEQAV